ncbi:MAG: T9SS type A sorting domain-containing protein [Rhodothermaceae bacterium]|nr:T9SS type A sorting domain-containing protein [Rhodothermaceae bacterium]MYG70770.1 T9SS type A sorting domain-containing protein [Rhodothermaceae bacterium]MYJ44274.1 T9SS type A sorting domain-containing protein [Rhodothermaceae bacterium]
MDNGIGAITAPVSVIVNEGGIESFEIALKAVPQSLVTVKLTGYENTGLTPEPISLEFSPTDWNIPQTVNLMAAEDDDLSDDEIQLVLNISGGGYSTSYVIAVAITDSDEGLISAPTSVTISEGGKETFGVALTTVPSSEVTMILRGHENTDLTPAPTTLTFGVDNWSTNQTVTLSTIFDEDLEDDEVTLTITGSGGGYDGVSQEVMITITDILGVDIETSELPVEVTLKGNYPNPFSATTKIEFDLPEPAQISVIVTDVLGRIIKSMPYGEFGAGRGHSLGIYTGSLTSGIYYYTLRVDMDGELVERSRAMTIVR